MAVDVQVHIHMDWTAEGHYEPLERPCRVCSVPTHERDFSGQPCMRRCAEQELERELIGQAYARIVDERLPLVPRQRAVAR